MQDKTDKVVYIFTLFIGDTLKRVDLLIAL